MKQYIKCDLTLTELIEHFVSDFVPVWSVCVGFLEVQIIFKDSTKLDSEVFTELLHCIGEKEVRPILEKSS